MLSQSQLHASLQLRQMDLQRSAPPGLAPVPEGMLTSALNSVLGGGSGGYSAGPYGGPIAGQFSGLPTGQLPMNASPNGPLNGYGVNASATGPLLSRYGLDAEGAGGSGGRGTFTYGGSPVAAATSGYGMGTYQPYGTGLGLGGSGESRLLNRSGESGLHSPRPFSPPEHDVEGPRRNGSTEFRSPVLTAGPVGPPALRTRPPLAPTQK